MALRISTGLRNKIGGISISKLTNGSFTTNTTGWTAVNADLTSVSGGQSGNCLQIATNSANVAKAYQDIVCQKGRVYQVGVYFKNGTATDKCRIKVGTTADESYYYDSGDIGATNWTYKLFWFKVTDGTGTETVRITLQNSDTSNTGLTVLFDEITCISMARALKDLFHKGVIKIYSGSQPTSADDAPTGTLLVTIYSDGVSEGLTFSDTSNGVLTKTPTETWTGTVVTSGVAGWFRLQAPGDSGSSSTTDERIDGAISTAGAELNLSSLNLTAGAVQAISSFQITIPAS